MKQTLIDKIDSVVKATLIELAADEHVRGWSAKERDWVNYYAHHFLLNKCDVQGPIKHAAQIGIEVGVPQPPPRSVYQKLTVSRDLVIWSDIGMTCWDRDWNPCQHPIAIMEWKVHRPGRRNKEVQKEEKWLTEYCNWQPSVVCYAVEVSGDISGIPLTCKRFLGQNKTNLWLELHCS